MNMLTGHVDELHTKLTDLQAQERSLKINTYTKLPSVTPTMVAHPNFRPVSPHYKASILLLCVVALTVAFGLAALRGQFDDRFHTRTCWKNSPGIAC